MLPDRGAFTFPPPYNTTGFRLTNAGDCGGTDCVSAVGYSYWNNINNHAGSETMLIFLGLDRNQGGTGPTLFSINKRSGETRNLGPIFDSDSPHSWNSAEGWYFSRTRPTTLYLNYGPRLLRYDLETRTFETALDVSTEFGADRYIWQVHSSNNDRVHSGTLRDSWSGAVLGCVAYREDQQQWYFAPRVGRYDECQVDKSGRWLVIKEDIDGRHGEDNRVIDLETRTERVLFDENGAGGHSDMGFGYMVAEDNYYDGPGAVRTWRFDLDVNGGQPVASVAGQGTLVYRQAFWGVSVGHVAHGNARSDLPPERQMACFSGASRNNLPRVNEIVCYRLDGSPEALVVAPNLTDLDAPGGGPDEYYKLPKGNLDPTGEYFVWTANAGSGRLDAFIVRVPTLLNDAAPGSAPAPSPVPLPDPLPSPPPPAPPSSPLPAPPSSPPPAPPEPAPAPTTTLEPVRWTGLVNAAAIGTTLEKNAGCDGCPDAGAVSEQQIASGDGAMQFTMAEQPTLRFIGFSTGSSGGQWQQIQFGLRLEGSTVEVRESGVYKSDIVVASGDTLEIRVDGGAVRYLKNGAVFYTSNQPPQYPLLVDSSLFTAGATMVDVAIRQGS